VRGYGAARLQSARDESAAGPGNGQISVTSAASNVNGVRVVTRDSAGEFANRSFHLIVSCWARALPTREASGGTPRSRPAKGLGSDLRPGGLATARRASSGRSPTRRSPGRQRLVDGRSNLRPLQYHLVLIGVEDEEELERLVLGYSPKFRTLLEAARQQIRDTGGIEHEEFWTQVEAEEDE
jgi:hypothetical protein